MAKKASGPSSLKTKTPAAKAKAGGGASGGRAAGANLTSKKGGSAAATAKPGSAKAGSAKTTSAKTGSAKTGLAKTGSAKAGSAKAAKPAHAKTQSKATSKSESKPASGASSKAAAETPTPAHGAAKQTKPTKTKQGKSESSPQPGAAAGKSRKSTSTRRSSGGDNSKRQPRSVAEAASGVAADKHGYVFINGRRVRMISTKARTTPRRMSVVAAVVNPTEILPNARPMKSPLKRKEMNYFRGILLEKRAELVGDLNSLETEALRSSGGELSHMPIHMADIGSDTYEQDFMLGLAETERARLREIDEALHRIEEGTYGVCAMTGHPIPRERLDAKPWAKHTIEAARLLERGGAA